MYFSESIISDKASATPSQAFIAGMRIDDLTLDGAVQRLVGAARKATRMRVSFANAHNLNLAWQDPSFRSVLRDSTLILGDGVGLQLVSRLTGQQLCDNVNGTDLFPRLWAACADSRLTVFLLGGRPGLASAAGERMDREMDSKVLAGARDGFFGPEQDAAVIESINDAKPDILLVGMGTPIQENWLSRHQHQLKVAVTVGVGGLFDFYSRRIPRAPGAWRRLGLEWVWRLLQEPGRMWRRYLLGNPAFIYRALRAGAKEMDP